MNGESTQFKPGDRANPRGRPKGSRHRLSEAFLAALSDDFEAEGIVAIAQARLDDAAAYCRIVASLLPKQSEKIENPLNGLNADELESLERHLENLRSAAIAREGEAGVVGEGEPT